MAEELRELLKISKYVRALIVVMWILSLIGSMKSTAPTSI